MQEEEDLQQLESITSVGQLILGEDRPSSLKDDLLKSDCVCPARDHIRNWTH